MVDSGDTFHDPHRFMRVAHISPSDLDVWVLFLETLLGAFRVDSQSKTLPFRGYLAQKMRALFAACTCYKEQVIGKVCRHSVEKRDQLTLKWVFPEELSLMFRSKLT